MHVTWSIGAAINQAERSRKAGQFPLGMLQGGRMPPSTAQGAAPWPIWKPRKKLQSRWASS